MPNARTFVLVNLLTTFLIATITPPSASQYVFQEEARERSPHWIVLCMCCALFLSIGLDSIHKGQYVGLTVIACVLGRLLIPDKLVLSLQESVLKMTIGALSWGWVASSVTKTRLYLILGMLYGISCIGHYVQFAVHNIVVDQSLSVGAAVVGLLWFVVNVPEKKPIGVQQGPLQRIVRVRTNGWVLVYGLWTSAPRALLRSERFKTARHDMTVHQGYVVAVLLGVTMMSSVCQWAVNTYGKKVLFLNGVWMLIVTLPSLWMMNSETITPSMYLMLAGFVLGGCEAILLALLLDMNESKDGVIVAALYMMTASVGACLGDMIEQIVMVTAPSKGVLVGGVAWFVGCMLIFGASTAATRDELQKEKRKIKNVELCDSN